MNKTKPKDQLLIWNIPREIKRRFKSTCVKNGSTMRKEIIRFMREYK